MTQNTEFEAKRKPVNTNELRAHVVLMAHNRWDMGMAAWNTVSNDILQAANELDDTRTQRNIERARADKAEAELARVREATGWLIEAAQEQLDYMDLCNDKGDLERNLRRAVALARAVKGEG